MMVMQTPMYSKDFKVQFLNVDGRAFPGVTAGELANNVKVVSSMEYNDDKFGIGHRGRINIIAYDTLDGLKGLDMLSKEPKFTLVINLTNKAGRIVAIRRLSECSIRKVHFSKLIANSNNDVTTTEFEMEFHRFSTSYPELETEV